MIQNRQDIIFLVICKKIIVIDHAFCLNGFPRPGIPKPILGFTPVSGFLL